MKNKETNQTNLELLKQVPKNEMTILVKGYLGYIAKYKYFRYIILIIFAVIVGYNFFVSGERFSIEEFKIIKNVIVSILGACIIALLVLAFILFKKLRKLKQEIKRVAAKYKIDSKSLRKEFHTFVKASIGGPGLR